MKILFLDDSNERINTIKKYLGVKSNILHIAESAPKAIALLKKYSPYDIVLLDHDLGDVNIIGEKTGYAVAKFITEMKPKLLPKRIIIHSHNPIGAMKMEAILKINGIKSEKIPFSERMFVTR